MCASEELPPVACLEPALRRLIEEAQRLFEERPIWTKRALRNHLNEADWKLVGENSAKYIWQYVGYLWASGPWRDALAKFGVDPRQDPSCRHYQTVMFILNSQPNHDRNLPTFKKKNARDTHIFDGRSIALDGKLYQICDITDPFIVSILSTSPIRDKCHVNSFDPSAPPLSYPCHSPSDTFFFSIGLRRWLVPKRDLLQVENHHATQTPLPHIWPDLAQFPLRARRTTHSKRCKR